MVTLYHAPQLSIIVPTLNERDNLHELVDRIDRCLDGVDWEIVFVDDNSVDGSFKTLHDLARSDRRVRFLHRIGRRGLASAVVEGILSTSSPFVAVMDADLQHDERALVPMLEALRDGHYDIAVGSRYLHAGSVEGWQLRRQTVGRVGLPRN